jgi:leucyl aminopeptidase
MPLATEYRPSLDTPHADIKNSGTRDGSLIKSAIFLSEFVTKPWVHVDIAGTAYLSADKAWAPKGCLGTGVSTLTRLAMDYAAKSGS